MFKNYFKKAWRNFLRHKLFSGLNIFGLASGMVTGVLKNIPSNSNLQPGMLIPMDLHDKVNITKYGWTNFDVYVYFQLKDAVAPTAANLNNINKQILLCLKEIF